MIDRWPEFFEGVYYFLQFLNLTIAIVAVYFYLLGSRTAKEPWKTLKRCFAVNLMISSAIYLVLIGGAIVEPLLIRAATTLLLTTLMVSAVLGAKRNDAG